MRTCVPCPRLPLFFLPLLAAALLSGCNGDRRAPPLAPPVEQVATLILSAGSEEIARFDDPLEVADLVSTLPQAERDELLATGTCTTDHPTFKLALQRLLIRNPGLPGPRNPNGPRGIVKNTTWGRIKLQMRHA